MRGEKMLELLAEVKKGTADLNQNTLYQILIGKRTPSSLFYAYSHQLLFLFNLCPQLSKLSWKKLGQVDHEPETDMQTLLAGLKYRQGLFPKANHQAIQTSLLLFFQALANASHGEKSYQPLTQSAQIQYQVKRFFAWTQKKYRKKELATILGQELEAILATWPLEQADMLLARIGYVDLPALTYEELASRYHFTLDQCHLYYSSLIDRLMVTVLSADTSPLLKSFFESFIAPYPPWSDSANVSYHYIKQGYSLEEIAKNRHLKVSTIADHYVDIMLSCPEVLAQEASDLFGADLKKIDWSLAYDHFESFQKAFPKAPYWLYRYYQVIQVKEAGKEQARC
ncbi:hypothetical protein DBT54_08850 [Aerococcus loyolae]|uniref:Helicase Helix-turn-helix domain-containing protein n=2 Tax=Aerococcus TaxID=1375 RepID=A0A329NV88_9LACT|nr:hypothetical protein DBT54_08850 [Aerococcus loyolae]